MSWGRRRTSSLVSLSGWLVAAIFFFYILYHTDSAPGYSKRFASNIPPSLDPESQSQAHLLQQDARVNTQPIAPPPGSGGYGAVPDLPPASLPLDPPASSSHHTPPEIPSRREEQSAAQKKKDFSVFGPWSSFESLFFFGDSYTSTNFDVWGPGPAKNNPLGNHYGVEGEMAKPTWPVFITQTHNASNVLGYNFAVGGSTVDRSIAKPYILGWDFREEVDLFMDHYGPDAKYPKAAWDPDTTLFFIWFGINDLILEWYNEFPRELAMVPEFLSYRNTMDRLFAAGARKFMFLTVPPAYRSVAFSPAILLTIAEDMALFNSRIFELRTALALAYPAATFAIFDAHSFWARVIENPQEFAETRDVMIPTAVCEEPEDESEEQPLDISPDGAHMAFKAAKDKAKDKALKSKKEDGMAKWGECLDGMPMLNHLWTKMHGTAVIHNATAARIVQDCLGPGGKTGFCV